MFYSLHCITGQGTFVACCAFVACHAFSLSPLSSQEFIFCLAFSLRYMRSWRSAGTMTPACVLLSRSLLCASICSGIVKSFRQRNHLKCHASLHPSRSEHCCSVCGQRTKTKTRSFSFSVPVCGKADWLEEWWIEAKTSSEMTLKVPSRKAPHPPFCVAA